MSAQVYSVIDFETYSEADLKKVGAYEYSMHDSTEILCVAWRTGTRKQLKKSKRKDTKIWAPRLGSDSPYSLSDFLSLILDTDIVLVAHNAFFEQCITRNVFARKDMYSMKKKIMDAVRDPERWRCTIAQAQSYGFPRRLEYIGEALDLTTKKDMEGAAILKKFMKPRKPTKDDPATRHDDHTDFMRLLEYCETDIGSEVELFTTLPMLPDEEQAVWCLDQRINFRGYEVDRKLAIAASEITEVEKNELNNKALFDTGGQVVSLTQVAAVRKLLEEEGVYLPNLQKKTVEDAISAGTLDLDSVALRVLKARQSVGLTSLAKYAVFERMSRSTGRVRGGLNYHGASTGRWSANGVQPQNLSKPPIWLLGQQALAAEIASTGDTEMLRLLWGDPLQVLGGCVRSTIVAKKDHRLQVLDFAQIEARVVNWLADDEEYLERFAAKQPIYEEAGASIFNMSVADVIALGKDSYPRFVGKTSELGAGFQMGWERFQQQCEQFGQPVSDEIAKKAIDTYRSNHPLIVKLWRKVQDHAILAVKNPGRMYGTTDKYIFYVDGDFLFCELPSGRRLAYHKPEVRYEKKWGNVYPKLHHWGADNTRGGKWRFESTYGGKLVENITQAVARDVMVSSIGRCEDQGWRTILMVHDEAVFETPLPGFGKDQFSFKECKRLMEIRPDWAKTLPIAVEGFEGPRYKK